MDQGGPEICEGRIAGALCQAGITSAPPHCPERAATQNGRYRVADDLLPAGSTALLNSDKAATDASPQDVYRRYRRGLILMVQRLVGERATAEDICQDACRVVAERLSSTGLEQPDKLVAFLHQTARNLAIAERRKRARRQTDVDSEALDGVADMRFDPCADAEREQCASVVRTLLNELNQSRDRLLLLRFYCDEADKSDICAELGLTAEQFTKVLFRAKRRFREILERAGVGSLWAIAGLCLVGMSLMHVH
jgi:RNA polymerase sigma-70 factor (ECF subfamily)